MSALSCEQVAELADELAIDALPGDLRGLALAHFEQCSPCRAMVEALAETADELLGAIPSVEPSPGFADRVLVRLASERKPAGRRFRSPRALIAAAAAVVALLAGFGAVGQLAASSERHGAEMRTVQLISTRGEVVGDASRYLGRPGWIFMRVDHGVDSGTDRCVIELNTGTRIPIGNLIVTGGKGAWGQHLSVDPHQVRAARLVSLDGVTLATAVFPNG